jgi:hypothetical protein
LDRINSVLFFFIVLLTGFMIFKSIDFGPVEAQDLSITATTANVSVKGYLDKLNITYFPVNFTIGVVGNQPGDTYPKINQQPFLEVSTGILTNVEWNISINGTYLVNELGNRIPVENISFNSTGWSALRSLSNQLQDIAYDVPAQSYERIYFYLTIPVGSANGTYKGDIWIYAWSNKASEDYNNDTWTGLENTTVTVAVTYGVEWTLKPINFGMLNPGTVEAKALNDYGWPTNITIVDNTNVPVDMYINGTDSKNITYSNYTLNQYTLTPDLSQSFAHTLNNNHPVSTTHGDFVNWGAIPNNTDVFSYWNISIPNIPGGIYYGNVTAKVVVTGENP